MAKKKGESMNIKIAFQNMPHSDPMEEHVRQKLEKITEILHDEAELTPFNIDVELRANPSHPHHRVNVHLKTAHLSFNTHEEGTDMYFAIDSAIDKMVEIAKKEREKRKDKRRGSSGPKADFESDKYSDTENL